MSQDNSQQTNQSPREKELAFRRRLAKNLNHPPSVLAEDIRLQRLEKSIDRICTNRMRQCERKQKEVKKHLAELEAAKIAGRSKLTVTMISRGGGGTQLFFGGCVPHRFQK